MAETAIVSFHTLPVGLPLPTISKNSMYKLFCSPILDRGVLLKISISAPKILQVLTSSDESPGHTIPTRSSVSKTLVFLICTILPRCHHAGFSS